MSTASHLCEMGPWRIPLVLAVTTFVHYLDRNTLALALPQIAAEQGWSDREVGLYGEVLLGAFYVSFGLVQIFLSPLAEKWSPKGSLALSVLGFSVVTLLFWPLGDSLLALIGLRFLLGAAESVHMPMNSAIVGQVFPPGARSRANSLYVGGILLALGLSPLLLVPLIQQLGWRKVFGLLGAGGLLVSLPLVLRYIPAIRSTSAPAEGRLWQDRRLWLYIAAGSANAFCIFGLLNWLPTYLHRSRGIPFGELSAPLFGIFLAGIVGLGVWAWSGDRWTQRGLSYARIQLARYGLAAAGLCVLLTSLPLPNLGLLALLTLGVFLQSSYNAQEFATLQTLYAGQPVGAITGLYNGLTVLVGGVGGSFIPGTLVAWTGSFQIGILSIAGGAALVSGLLYLLERQEKATLRKSPG